MWVLIASGVAFAMTSCAPFAPLAAAARERRMLVPVGHGQRSALNAVRSSGAQGRSGSGKRMTTVEFIGG